MADKKSIKKKTSVNTNKRNNTCDKRGVTSKTSGRNGVKQKTGKSNRKTNGSVKPDLDVVLKADKHNGANKKVGKNVSSRSCQESATVCFDFVDIIETSMTKIAMFATDHSYMPALLDSQRFYIIKGFLSGDLTKLHCGIHSLVLDFFEAEGYDLNGVYMSCDNALSLPTTTLMTSNDKHELHPFSHKFILPDDAVVCAVLADVPIVINDDVTMQSITFSLNGASHKELIDVFTKNLRVAEEKALI